MLWDDIFEVELDDISDLSLKIVDVEVNLEFLRFMNLDSESILNEDLDDVCEDKLKVSDVKTSLSVLGLDSNLRNGQAD